MQMITLPSSSPSSSHYSQPHCNREERYMRDFEHLRLRGKKHHHHRHHSRPSPPPPPHRCHHFVEHPHHSPLALHPFGHHHGKLRVKTPKHSKKVRTLHHKLMKACKLPAKSARHSRHQHHMHCPPPQQGFLGCCRHIMEEEGFSCEEQHHRHEMGFHCLCRPHHTVNQHPSRMHELCPMRPIIKSEIVGCPIAGATGEAPIQGGPHPPCQADETALAP